MTKKVVAVALMLVLCSSFSSYGFIHWFNESTNMVYYNGGVTPLPGNRTDSTIGCFIQLIWVGGDGFIDLASNSGTGVTDDDQVSAYSWMGSGIFSDPNGYVSATPDAYTNSGLYYVRAWTAPSADFANGLVPTSATNFYGNSPTFNYTKPDPESSVDFNFGVDGDGGGWSTTLQAIPEPTILGLGLIGAVCLRLYRRRSSK
ncbi:MAG: hypothetical protein V1873_03335 [Verrucomicrobiota bacterium]